MNLDLLFLVFLLGMAWTSGVDRATGYLVTSSDWNALLGSAGSLNELIEYAFERFSIGNITGSTTVNWDNGLTQEATVTGNVTFNAFTNAVAGYWYGLRLTQSGAGAFTYTWNANVHWADGVGPVGSATGKTDVVTFYYDGSVFWGSYQVNYT